MNAHEFPTVTESVYRVTVANGSHDIAAASALVACEQAQERWGTWPDRIEKVS